MTARPMQTSLLPDVPDRPTGRVPGSVQTGTNADLIATIAPIYLTGAVVDLTYGLGRWWTRFMPDDFTAHDIDPDKGDGVDFRCLPEPDDSYDAVCFDPPYVPAGGTRTAGATEGEANFRSRFGLVPRSRPELLELVAAGMTEAGRVSRRWVLAKCSDYVSGGAFYLGHLDMIAAAAACGLTVHDLIVHHTGSGPGGHNITDILRARRHHSYLIVFDASLWVPRGAA